MAVLVHKRVEVQGTQDYPVTEHLHCKMETLKEMVRLEGGKESYCHLFSLVPRLSPIVV